MNSMRDGVHLIGIALFLPLLFSCGQRNAAGKLPVRGSVTYQGKLLQEGAISFLKVNAATSASASIRDGLFRLAAGQGLEPGKYRVEIQAMEKTGKTIPGVGPGGKIEEMKQIIPARYNQKSELSIELTRETAMPLEFKLTKP